MENVCHGCDVHAKRICLEKVSTKKTVCSGVTYYEDANDPIYTWAVGTRRVLTELQVVKAISEMDNLGKNGNRSRGG